MINKSPVKNIRNFCLTNCLGTMKEVRNCANKECPLYFYRMGKNPSRKGVGGNPYLKKQGGN
jgi:hypothetical protein